MTPMANVSVAKSTLTRPRQKSSSTTCPSHSVLGCTMYLIAPPPRTALHRVLLLHTVPLLHHVLWCNEEHLGEAPAEEQLHHLSQAVPCTACFFAHRPLLHHALQYTTYLVQSRAPSLIRPRQNSSSATCLECVLHHVLRQRPPPTGTLMCPGGVGKTKRRIEEPGGFRQRNSSGKGFRRNGPRAEQQLRHHAPHHME